MGWLNTAWWQLLNSFRPHQGFLTSSAAGWDLFLWNCEKCLSLSCTQTLMCNRRRVAGWREKIIRLKSTWQKSDSVRSQRLCLWARRVPAGQGWTMLSPWSRTPQAPLASLSVTHTLMGGNTGKNREGWRTYCATIPRKIRTRRGCAFWWLWYSLPETKLNPNECWG